MTALSKSESERFLARPDPRRPVVLIYGPDAGLVAERAARLAASAVSDTADSLQLLRFDGDEFAGDPPRLADEANGGNLFGGRRALRLRVGSRNLAPAVEILLRAPPLDATVLLEAGDLRKTSPLLLLCEKSPHAAVILCRSEPEDGRRLVETSLRAAGVTLDPDAAEALFALLRGDRLALRGEIDKLVSYLGANRVVTLADVEAAVGDPAEAAANEAVDAAFSGNLAALGRALARLAAGGERPDGLLRAALQHAWLLAGAEAQLPPGQPTRGAAERVRLAGVRRNAFEAQLGLWRRESLARTIRRLGEAIRQARIESRLAESVAERALLFLADEARRAR